jgi:cyclophilin family peptidyl-prolyl cis-trans isomerase
MSLASLAMLGAGCAWDKSTVSGNANTNTKTDTYAYSQDSSTGSDQKTPEPTSPAPTPSPTPTPMPTQPTGLKFPGVLPAAETNKKVLIKTSKGDIEVQVMPDQGPNAASNFIYLAKQKYFDGLTFHRREPGFVIQGGDPLGNGTGGPGYAFADDTVKPVGQNPLIGEGPAKGYVTYKRGTVAMANAGPDTNGSQFFIMLGDVPLPPSYSVFGKVLSGMEAVDAIAVGDVMTSVTIK